MFIITVINFMQVLLLARLIPEPVQTTICIFKASGGIRRGGIKGSQEELQINVADEKL